MKLDQLCEKEQQWRRYLGQVPGLRHLRCHCWWVTEWVRGGRMDVGGGWIEAPAPHRHRRPPPAHPARIPGCRSQPKGAKCSQKWPNVAKRGQSGRKWPKVVKGSPTGLSSNRKHSSMQTSPQPLMQPTAFLIQRHSNIADVNSQLHTKPLTSHTQINVPLILAQCACLITE